MHRSDQGGADRSPTEGSNLSPSRTPIRPRIRRTEGVRSDTRAPRIRARIHRIFRPVSLRQEGPRT